MDASNFKNFLGKPLQLIWTMRKINNPLSISGRSYGAEQSQTFFKYPKHLSAIYYDNGNLYMDKEEIQLLSSFIRYNVSKDKLYPIKVFKKANDLAKKIQKQKINKITLKKLSTPQLIKKFKKERGLWLDMMGFMSYRGSIQMADVLQSMVLDILTNKLIEKKLIRKKDQILELFLTPFKPSVIWEEKKALLKIAEKKETKDITVLLQQHIKKFNWINYHWFIGKDLEITELTERIEAIQNPTKELKKMLQEKKQTEHKIHNIISSLKFSKPETNLLLFLRTWIYARTFVKDMINLAAYKLLPTLSQLAKNTQIPENNIMFLTLEEIDHINLLTKKFINKVIEDRKTTFSAGVLENKFKIIKINIDTQEQEIPKKDTLSGACAMKGYVRGTAKIILSPKEINKIKKGEILVTSMTTPDFLPAMEKAAAFITDEGGITCHAAIVAREMKKPCIIGTKNATKILKDGDIIEVNANEGIIKVLNN